MLEFGDVVKLRDEVEVRGARDVPVAHMGLVLASLRHARLGLGLRLARAGARLLRWHGSLWYWLTGVRLMPRAMAGVRRAWWRGSGLE